MAIPADPQPVGFEADLYRRYMAGEIPLDDFQRRLGDETDAERDAESEMDREIDAQIEREERDRDHEEFHGEVAQEMGL